MAVMLHDLRAAAFAPPLLAAVSPRQSLLRSVRPGLLAARCVFESERTACCTGPLSRGRLLRLSAAASEQAAEENTSPKPAKKTAAVEKHAAVPGKAVVALCALGCVLGFYALYVGTLANAPPPVPVGGRSTSGAAAKSGYKAWCDFSAGASCSTVARLQYGIGLGLIKANGPWGFLALPNALYGIFYYVALSLTQLPSTFAVPRARQIALILSFTALSASVYLGYLLAFVIKNLCVVCVATYAVNAALLKLSLADYKAVVASLRAVGSVGARAKGLVLSDREARGETSRVVAEKNAATDDNQDSSDQDSSDSSDPTSKDHGPDCKVAPTAEDAVADDAVAQGQVEESARQSASKEDQESASTDADRGKKAS